MANLSISISDSVLSATLVEAVRRNTPLDAYIEGILKAALSSTAFQPRPSINMEALLQRAVSVAQSKPSGTIFLVKELCNPLDWESTTAGERKVLGKRFRKIVEDPDNRIAQHDHKTSSNQAVYIRV